MMKPHCTVTSGRCPLLRVPMCLPVARCIEFQKSPSATSSTSETSMRQKTACELLRRFDLPELQSEVGVLEGKRQRFTPFSFLLKFGVGDGSKNRHNRLGLGFHCGRPASN